MLVISANSGLVTMTKEHIGYAIALEVPFFIIMTKVDITPKPKLQATLESLKKFLANVGSKKVRFPSALRIKVSCLFTITRMI